jgi:hypothetical protein
MKNKKVLLATLLSIALVLPVVQQVVEYVQLGIERGASIRVSKTTTCAEGTTASFGGCSSIL